LLVIDNQQLTSTAEDFSVGSRGHFVDVVLRVLRADPVREAIQDRFRGAANSAANFLLGDWNSAICAQNSQIFVAGRETNRDLREFPT
jgi:hypothetical protein